MATGSLVPGTQTGWDFNVYQRVIEAATYEKMKLIPIVDEAMRLHNQLTIRKHARVQGVALSSTADGTGLSYLNPVGTPVTVVPVHSIVPIAWGPNFSAQADFNVSTEVASTIEDSLAELTESNVFANFQSATQFMSAADVTQSLLRQALARLQGNTNGMFGVGGTAPIYGFFSHTQQPILQGFPEVNSAEARGDGENPYVKGIWVNGFGFKLYVSTVVPNDGNGWHNGLLAASALVTSWNEKTNIQRPDIELAKTAIAQNNMGSNIKHDARILVIRTTNNNA